MNKNLPPPMRGTHVCKGYLLSPEGLCEIHFSWTFLNIMMNVWIHKALILATQGGN